MNGGNAACAERKLEIQAGILYLVIAESLTDGDRAFGRPHRPLPLIGARDENSCARSTGRDIIGDNWPDSDDRVAGEFHHISPVIVDDIDQLSEVFVENTCQSFHTGRSPLGEMLGQNSKARNVRE